MKNLFLILAFILFTFPSYSQDVIRQQPCNNSDISRQADSIREVLTRNGFMIVKEASMMMESEYEMPVIVPLTEGSWYQFVFIGDISSRLYEVRMYDWQENQVAYEKNLARDANANIVSYAYVARNSEFHMIKPLQINKKKKKDLCGYVMLLKRVR